MGHNLNNSLQSFMKHSKPKPKHAQEVILVLMRKKISAHPTKLEHLRWSRFIITNMLFSTSCKTLLRMPIEET